MPTPFYFMLSVSISLYCFPVCLISRMTLFFADGFVLLAINIDNFDYYNWCYKIASLLDGWKDRFYCDSKRLQVIVSNKM